MRSDQLPRDRVQRVRPFGVIAPKRRNRLRFEQIHPVIRIAHKMDYPLLIPERIIYDHEFVLILRGRGVLRMQGCDHPYASGALIFIPAFMPHSFVDPDKALGSHIAIHFDFCAGAPSWPDGDAEIAPYEIVFPGSVTCPALVSAPPGHVVDRLLREIVALHAADATDPLAGVDASSRLTAVIVQSLRWGALGAAGREVTDAVELVNRRRIAVAVEYIAAHYAEPITLANLADAAGISRSRFAAVFREATGQSPMQYVQQARVGEARRLLADATLSIKQIAAKTGFEDGFYFSRVFRKVDGLSPSQFRAAALAGPAQTAGSEE